MKGIFFQAVEKWSGMTPLSTGRMFSGVTAWWSTLQRRLVNFDRVWSEIQRK